MNMTEWPQRQTDIFEKMTADLQLKSDFFRQKWALIETYLLERKKLNLY